MDHIPSLLPRAAALLRPFRAGAMAAAVAVAALVQADPASAYSLYNAKNCHPGLRWDPTLPVKVKVLSDSFSGLAYKDTWRTDQFKQMIDDALEVIEVYNGVPGSGLRLEYDGYLPGLADFPDREGGLQLDQTIVIGFTGWTHAKNESAEAWAPGGPDEVCDRTRAYILFRKDVNWVFGPPETTDVDGRHFSTADQPPPPTPKWPVTEDDVKQHTFLGILTHEMGHAIGLGHPDDDYAVMAQDFRTWFRGPHNVLRAGLLPDDIAGVRALYAVSDDPSHLDISVSNTWFNEGSSNAFQSPNCKVSSRGDAWSNNGTTDADREPLLCGVNAASGSGYPTVSNTVCPGSYIQLRYTLNNNSLTRSALVKSEVWFSANTKLNLHQETELKSPDLREFTLGSGRSATIGQIYRVPTNVVAGKTYWVFVRAVPYDTESGKSLWLSDEDRWNNGIMVRSSLVVSSPFACA